MNDQKTDETIEPSDGSLLRRIQGGEEDAATQLYLRYSNRLIALAKHNTSPELAVRFDPEDVVQPEFRSFFRRASGGCYDVPEGGELWRLLLVLALNKVRGLAIHHRAQKRSVRQTMSGEAADQVLQRHESQNPEPYQILQMVVDQILGTMTPLQRQIVELRIEGCSVPEIAESTGRSKRTVERVLQGFREQLSARIGTEDNHDQA